MIKTAKADMIIDLQFGSTGKGLIAGYLAMKHEYDVVVTANMPNAGHTFIDHAGNIMIHKVLPNGVVSPQCNYALIGPGAVFSWEQLNKELNHLNNLGYKDFDVIIHPNSVPLRESHREAEKINVTIGSTMQGSGAAIVDRIRRNPDSLPISSSHAGFNGKTTHLSRGNHKRVNIVSQDEYNMVIEKARNILLEGAQGFSLGISERFYPFCTSRDCTPARFMADMAIPLPYLRKVIGTARIHPIRVGNPPGGHSGGCYFDQKEITWEEIGVEAEKTTVTQRVRRVFTFSKKQIQDAMYATMPDEIFLNFCNYADKELYHGISEFLGPKLKYTGWGPTVDDILEKW